MKDYITIHINKKTLEFSFWLIILCSALFIIVSLLGMTYDSIYDSGYDEGYRDGDVDGGERIIDEIIHSENLVNEITFLNRMDETRQLYFEECPNKEHPFYESDPFFSYKVLKEDSQNGDSTEEENV